MGRFNDIFLTNYEKDTFSNFKDETTDSRLSHLTLSPLFEWLATLFPSNISPNIISVVGLLITIHSYYLSFFYIDKFPRLISAVCILFVILQLVGDGVVDKHARNSMQDTPLFDLFRNACNVGSYVFSTLTGCLLLGIDNHATQWYLVQIGQLLSLTQHLGAFKRANHAMRYPMFTGPGEIIFSATFGIVASLFVGDIRTYFRTYLHIAASFFNSILGTEFFPLDNYKELILITVHCLYSLLLVIIILEVALTLPKKSYASRNGLLLCLLYRGCVPLVLSSFGVYSTEQLSTPLSTICDGLFLSVITVDMIVGKMSNRDLHPWLVVFAMLSLMSDFLTILCVVIYTGAIFFEISDYMELNMFAVTINVFVDGAYDMCHLGHINSFKVALSYGTRLFVGVLSDESIQAYKRRPIMTLDERAETVAKCKYVHKVIKDSPGNGLTEDFIKKYKIHIVCHSEEYNKPDDHYYKVPRAMHICRVTPRTEGVSTSGLIKRVSEYLRTGGELENKQEKAWKEEAEAKNAQKK